MGFIRKIEEKTLSRVLTVVLSVILLGTLGTLVYVLVTPRVHESFTEFYILGSGGKLIDYPKEVTLGDEGEVIMGIINHENRSMTYRVAITINGVANNEIGSVVLDDGEKWEKEATFKPTKAGDDKVEFFLYKEGSTTTQEQLQLWVKVVESK